MYTIGSQALRDPSTHGSLRGQVKSNTLTCTCKDSCTCPIRLQERFEIFVILGPRQQQTRAWTRECSMLRQKLSRVLVIPP